MNALFVAQSGMLEVQALLLAMSLRKHAPHIRLKACVPIQFGELHFLTRDILRKLEVEIVVIQNYFDPVYPVGNKLSTTSHFSSEEMSLFLDSDILCVRDFRKFDRPTVITTGRYDVISHLEWSHLFQLFDLEMPIRFDHIRSPLVFADLAFAERWRNNALKLWTAIHNYGFSLRKIRQVDQISLTITVLQNEGFDIRPWHDNVLQSPSELYNFDKNGQLKDVPWPYFVVLQKGWLYYSRQGCPQHKVSNPNSLAYYPEIRSMIYGFLSEYPDLDRIPAWKGVHGFYLSQEPLAEEEKRNYMRGVEGDQK